MPGGTEEPEEIGLCPGPRVQDQDLDQRAGRLELDLKPGLKPGLGQRGKGIDARRAGLNLKLWSGHEVRKIDTGGKRMPWNTLQIHVHHGFVDTGGTPIV